MVPGSWRYITRLRKRKDRMPVVMSLPAVAAPQIPTGSNSLPVLPAVPALDNTFGAVLIGTCIGLM